MQIQDRVALVTGSSSGLGAAVTARLLAQGAKVVGLDLAPPRMEQPLEVQDRFVCIQTDVTSQAEVAEALQIARERFGAVHFGVCCAGILHGERVVGKEGPASLEAFRRVLEINVCGTFNVVSQLAALMAKNPADSESGERGVLVATSSVAATEGQIGQAAYSASKGAVASMTLPIARELGRFGIRMVSIAPGVFETPMMQAASDRVRQPLLDLTIFPKRFGQADEFARFVVHILENSMVNGAVLRLDGALRM